jgi:hypothetical protein
MTVTGMIAGTIDIAVNALGPPLAEVNMMIVAHPGLRLPGGRLMINGLQGTMITGAEAMMTAERLIIIMTAVGMIKIAAEMTKGATKKKNDTKKGRRGMLMAKDGRVERFLNEERVQEKRMASDRFFPFYTGLPRFGVIVVYADRVLLLWLGNTPWRTVWRICHISPWHAPRAAQLFRSEVKALLQSNGWSKERGLTRDSHAQV